MQVMSIWFRWLRPQSAFAAMFAIAVLLTMGGVGGASAKPYIFNGPFTAKPGDYVSITGTGFGSAPRAYITPAGQAFRELQGVKGKDTSVLFRIPANVPFTQYQVWIYDNSTLSEPVLINAPRGMHFDGPEVAAGGALRVFGHNLYLGSGTPSASFVDVQTGATLSAQVNVQASDAYSLSLNAPGGVVAGKTYRVMISNGYGSAYADKTILGRATGGDVFGLGVAWGADFAPAPNTKYVFDVKNDPTLPLRAKGDGVTNDAPAIQAAIEAAKSIKGSIVYLPAGTYYLGGEQSGPGLLLRSNTVLYGTGVNSTKITYGPRSAKNSSYAYAGLSIQAGSTRVGIIGMSIQNVDATSQNVVNLTTDAGAVSSRIFISQVNWDLGSGKGMYIRGDKIAIINSTIRQSPNRQFPTGDGSSGAGPIGLDSSTNLVFRGNTVSWASGELQFNNITNAVLENNRFARSAADQMVATAAQTNWPSTGRNVVVGEVVQRGVGRNISANFTNDMVIQNNIFAADSGLKNNWSDGETILSEAGALAPRQDSGVVSSASGTTITDNSRCSSCSWNVNAQSVVVLINGAGAGQWRNVTARNGNTFTIDAPWNVAPAAGDRFQLAQPSLKNVIIRGNTMSNNPIGVSLFDGAYLNVSIIGNNLTNNGGIYLRPVERYRAQWQTFSTYRDIEINNNVVRNTTGFKPAYISVFFALVDQTSFWGQSVDGVEIRNNQITGLPGTYPYPVQEGYGNYVIYQNAFAQYAENNRKPLVGTIFQGNACTNCAINYYISTGALDTVIWNSWTSNSSGVASTFVDDRNIYYPTTKVTSVGTIIGND